MQQIIAVVFLTKAVIHLMQRITLITQGRRQDVAAGGPKVTRGGTFLNTILDVCSNCHEKSRLRYVNFIHI